MSTTKKSFIQRAAESYVNLQDRLCGIGETEKNPNLNIKNINDFTRYKKLTKILLNESAVMSLCSLASVYCAFNRVADNFHQIGTFFNASSAGLAELADKAFNAGAIDSLEAIGFASLTFFTEVVSKKTWDNYNIFKHKMGRYARENGLETPTGL